MMQAKPADWTGQTSQKEQTTLLNGTSRAHAPSDEVIIHADALTKVYARTIREPGLKGSVKALFHREMEQKTALSGLNLTIRAGELVGLIGPNGAGKTTLVKLLSGIIQPTSGSVSVLGFRPGDLKDDFRRSYAVVMGQKSQLWWDLPASDTFRLNREIYSIPKIVYERNLEEYTALFDVAPLLHVPVRNLSLGERMKMELMAALMHNPRLLFLDEPTIGLDAIAQKQIRRFLREVNERHGTTVLLTSHYMDDIRHVCPRTVVINEGTKVYDGSLEALLERFQSSREVHVTLVEPVGLELALPENILVTDRQPYRLSLRTERPDTRALLVRLLAEVEIEDIRIEDEEIGNVVERIYRAGREVDA